MKNKKDLSVAEKLLLAALSIEDVGKKPFTAEDLVIAAWRKFPNTFGLSGYLDKDGSRLYPDSNRVFAEIMGSKPIRKKGFLRKVGSKMYQLTEAGHQHASSLISKAADGGGISKISLSREVVRELQRLFSTKAVEKFKNNRKEEITFSDACAFWGISPRSSAIEFEGRVSALDEIIERAVSIVKDGDFSFKHLGSAFDKNDLALLKDTHEHMLDRFKDEISFIRNRTDERA